MPALIFRFNKESKSLEKLLIKDSKLSTEQSLKYFKIFEGFSQKTIDKGKSEW